MSDTLRVNTSSTEALDNALSAPRRRISLTTSPPRFVTSRPRKNAVCGPGVRSLSAPDSYVPTEPIPIPKPLPRSSTGSSVMGGRVMGGRVVCRDMMDRDVVDGRVVCGDVMDKDVVDKDVIHKDVIESSKVSISKRLSPRLSPRRRLRVHCITQKDDDVEIVLSDGSIVNELPIESSIMMEKHADVICFKF